MDRRLRVLVVEDDAVNMTAISQLMGRKSHGVSVEGAGTLAEGLERVRRNGIDAVILDLTLPDAEGTQAVERLCAEFPHLPVVVYTGAGYELEAACLKAGAEDYVLKAAAPVEQLVKAIRHAVIRHQVYMQYRPLKEKLEKAKEVAAEGLEKAHEAKEMAKH